MKRKTSRKLPHIPVNTESRRPSLNAGKKASAAGDADWKPSPFDGIEKKLPVNVVRIDRWNQEALSIVNDPISNWPNKYTDDVLGFKRSSETGYEYEVLSLVTPAANLATECLKTEIENIDVLYVNGEHIEVAGGLTDAFDNLLIYLCNQRQDAISALEVSGLLKWIVKTDDNASLISNVANGTVAIKFDTYEAVCKRMQWLLMMTGFNLDTVAIRLKYSEAKTVALRSAAEAKKQRKQEAKKQRARENSKKKYLKAMERKIIAEMRPKYLGNMPRVNPHVERTPHGGRSNPIRFDQGTYIVQDGLVVFINRYHDKEDLGGDSRVMRSDVDNPDEWKGYGVARPDNGRFGGIITEDWSD